MMTEIKEWFLERSCSTIAIAGIVLYVAITLIFNAFKITVPFYVPFIGAVFSLAVYSWSILRLSSYPRNAKYSYRFYYYTMMLSAVGILSSLSFASK